MFPVQEEEKNTTTNVNNTNNNFSVYYAKVGCLLCVDNRYIVCIVANDNHPIGNQKLLSQLPWISFQTREIEDMPMKLKSQEIKNTNSTLLKDKITLKYRLKDRYVYYAEKNPVKVELLFSENENIFSETGTLQSALDTYNCSISFVV